jgi:hypothetical protein
MEFAASAVDFQFLHVIPTASLSVSLSISAADDEVDMRDFYERILVHLGRRVLGVAKTGRELVILRRGGHRPDHASIRRVSANSTGSSRRARAANDRRLLEQAAAILMQNEAIDEG